jgi:KaiC/GvpD/RAD55 family RecA-like ATPase
MYRAIPAKWLWEGETDPQLIKEKRRSRSGEFTDEELRELNAAGYNIYYLPNHPSKPVYGRPTNGRDVDVWNYVFADMDLKDKKWESKEAFLEVVRLFPLKPSAIVDSGRGIHVYWRVTDLDAMSFLRLQRRISVQFNTDPAVANMHQLMRVPGTVNVKDPNPDNWVLCEVIQSSDKEYDAQTMDAHLPRITPEDEAHCKRHYEKTMNDPGQLAPQEALELSNKAKLMWGKMLKDNAEVKKLINYEEVKDRSTADWRLAHLLLASGFKRNDARAILMTTGKAIERAPIHQFNYAENIVDKLWEEKPVKKIEAGDALDEADVADEDDDFEDLSSTVEDILIKSAEAPRNTRIRCHEAIDATVHGYRLGEVLGLVGGAGSGKTTFSLNMFHWFFERNPEYIHIFVTLEQPEDEIAERWRQMAGSNSKLYKQVRIIGNYDKDGMFRNLSLQRIEKHVKALEKKTGQKVGCVVIDHIAILNYERETKEMKDKLSGLCEQMKQFAVRTNTFLIMQSQTSRQKAGVGDVELDKDAAYGTGYFEFYADYVVTTWQPLKRLYGDDKFKESDNPLYVNCWKYCKIRHKKANKDKVQEDQVYAFRFDIDTDRLRPLHEDEYSAFEFQAKKATQLRNKDKKLNPAPLKVISWATPVEEPKK